jgi:hypothetical protein
MSLQITTEQCVVVVDTGILNFRLSEGKFTVKLYNQADFVAKIDAFAKSNPSNANLWLVLKGLVFALSDSIVEEELLRFIPNEIGQSQQLFAQIDPENEYGKWDLTQFCEQFILDGEWHAEP